MTPNEAADDVRRLGEGVASRVRFGTCTPSVRARIEAIQDEARLRELALAVVTVSSLSEFEALAVE